MSPCHDVSDLLATVCVETNIEKKMCCLLARVSVKQYVYEDHFGMCLSCSMCVSNTSVCINVTSEYMSWPSGYCCVQTMRCLFVWRLCVVGVCSWWQFGASTATEEHLVLSSVPRWSWLYLDLLTWQTKCTMCCCIHSFWEQYSVEPQHQTLLAYKQKTVSNKASTDAFEWSNVELD